MSVRLGLPLVAILALLLAAPPARSAEPLPQLLPTRDVDITYDVTRPDQPPIRERRRWLAEGHLRRVDGPDKSSTIFDPTKNEVTLLNPKTRSFRKLDGVPRRPADPQKGAVLTRGGETVIAGLHCVDWSWTEDTDTHTVCVTEDGVLLRLIINGRTILQARSVTYGKQPVELFQIPHGYSPALAPEGSHGD